MAVVEPDKEITVYEIDSDRVTVAHYDAFVRAGSDDEALALIREWISRNASSRISGRVVKGWSCYPICISPRPILRWFMDLITGTSSPREYWYRIDIHLQRLGSN